MQEIRNEKKKSESDFQCQALSSDVEKFKAHCNHLKLAINLMEKYFIQCIEQAEVKNGMSLVIVDNWLKRKSKETKKNLDVPEKGNLDLEHKRRKLVSWIFSRFVCMLLHKWTFSL